MLGFLKKLFGMDKETMKNAGVQIEQQAPYKVEPVAVVVETVAIKEVPAKKTKVDQVKPTASKKPRGPKKPQGPKPTAKPAAPKRGRKPKVS